MNPIVWYRTYIKAQWALAIVLVTHRFLRLPDSWSHCGRGSPRHSR